MDSKEKETANRRPVIVEDQPARLQEPNRVARTYGICVVLDWVEVEVSVHRVSFVGGMAPIEGRLAAVGVGQLPVLITYSEKHLVRLDRVHDLIAYHDSDDDNISSLLPIGGLNGCDPRWYGGLSVVEGHLLKIVEKLRREPISVRKGPGGFGGFGRIVRNGCAMRNLCETERHAG